MTSSLIKMIYKKIFILSVFISLIISNGYAQSIADITVPKIIPPPPEAAALGKYGQVPVDKVSGIPQISIPLYEIKTPRFTVPISLSYMASGLKVDETATWVGAGWSLNAGGVITRSIVNLPDEYNYLSAVLKTRAEIINTNNTSYVNEAINTPVNLDTQPDNFYYNFLDKSGGFVFGKDRLPLLIPYKPIKIVRNNLPVATGGTYTVTDENGNTYYFTDTEKTISSVAESYSGTSSWYLTQMVSADKSDTVKFVYANNTQPYNLNSFSFSQNYGPYVNSNGCGWDGSGSLWNMSKSRTQRTILNPVYIKTILFKNGRVDFVSKAGRLDGPNLSLDSVIVSGYDYKQSRFNRLKSFKLHTGYFFNDKNLPPGNYFATGNKYRLRLDSLTENDRTNSSVKTHKFGYNSVLPPPVNFFAQDYWGYYNGKDQNKTLLEAKQYMGNGSIGNAVYDVYTVGGTEGADRKPDTSYMKAGILERITYPTKGFTVFDYESHKFIDYRTTTQERTAQAASAGYYNETQTTFFTTDDKAEGTYEGFVHVLLKHTNGFPGQLPQTPYVEVVKVSTGAVIYSAYAQSVNDIDSWAGIQLQPNTQYKLYALSKGGASSTNQSLLPTANINIRYGANSTNTPLVSDGGGLRIRTIKNYDKDDGLITKESYRYHSSVDGAGDLPNGSLNFLNRYPRKFVNIWLDDHNLPDDCSANEIVYSNNSLYSLTTFGGSPVLYSGVSVFQGDEVENTGYSLYNYTSYPDSINTVDPEYQNGVQLIPVNWKNGKPTYEAHYRKIGNGQYRIVQEKGFEYEIIPRAAGYGLYIGERRQAVGYSLYNWPDHLLSDYIFFDYPISTGSYLPKQTVTINFDKDGVSLQRDTVNYYYDNRTHVQPTRITQNTSKKELLLKQISYPQDMVLAAKDPTGIYAAMTAANIISPAIEFTESKNNTQLRKSKTNYFLTNSMIEPRSVELQTLTSPSEVRLDFQRYDVKGNLITVSKKDGPTERYIYDYNSALPVAKVSNAGVDTNAYTSFEADGTGNWTIPSSTRNITEAQTGNRSYTLSNGALSKTGLSTTKTYIVSYWTKNSSPITIAGTLSGYPLPGIAINGWTYYEHRISGQSAITLAGTGIIDEVRLYPLDAQMMTYTYDPMIGTTSMCDAKSQITYYEYDGLQRLVTVRDQNKDIVKSICYNYANQQTGCVVLPPPPTITPFVKLETGSGYLGSDNHYYGSFVFKSFSDAAFTTAYNVTTNFSVQYRVTLTTTTGGSAPVITSSIYTTSIAAGTNSKTITLDVNTCGQAVVPGAVANKSTAQQTATGGGSTNVLPPGGGGGGDTSCTTATVELVETLNEQ